jgi:hypothetical protein
MPSKNNLPFSTDYSSPPVCGVCQQAKCHQRRVIHNFMVYPIKLISKIETISLIWFLLKLKQLFVI